jgi:hypothetical protein
MTHARRFALALAGIVSLVSTSASASETGDSLATEPRPEPRDVWSARPFAILGHVQTIGPMGVFGISGEYSFNPYFSAGLGLGMSSDPQGSAMARFRLPLDEHFGAGVGLGASYGKPFTLHLCVWSPCTQHEDPAVLSGDTEIFVEGRTTSGFTARLYGGAHQQLAFERRMNGYVGVAGGWSF